MGWWWGWQARRGRRWGGVPGGDGEGRGGRAMKRGEGMVGRVWWRVGAFRRTLAQGSGMRGGGPSRVCTPTNTETHAPGSRMLGGSSAGTEHTRRSPDRISSRMNTPGAKPRVAVCTGEGAELLGDTGLVSRSVWLVGYRTRSFWWRQSKAKQRG